jgi:hypothetical protein
MPMKKFEDQTPEETYFGAMKDIVAAGLVIFRQLPIDEANLQADRFVQSRITARGVQ